ncbi:LPS-assembly protein LptD [Cyanobium sp. LEGE 06113]|uniref:LptA/OstA family protein n=1 Tax=Cyanobium sp. LEGE 06113 TaxID=1297573 RepID=UPI001881C6FE|nr:LPS-assembly protein LptD [Cyanobium sp. LEGE 06113]
MPLSAFHPASVALLGLAAFGLPASSLVAGARAQEMATPAAAPETAPLTGVVTIESDLQSADNATGILSASGNVRIVYGDQGVVATARQAQYFSREGRLVLSGDVDVLQGDGNSIRAERLVYFVENERLVAESAPGEQVTTLYRFPPTQAPDPAALP